MKKQPNFLCAKVLKALILQRLGREAECEELLEEACSYAPTDEATLQAITICYRAIHKRKYLQEQLGIVLMLQHSLDKLSKSFF